jgi:hypothetical protein
LVVAVASAALAASVLLRKPAARPLPEVASSPGKKAAPSDAAEIDAFAKKRMSRQIVKVAPPPPPKPVLPALDTLVRLAGVVDYGPKTPKEAYIETKQNSQTRTYRVGDVVDPGGARVKAIDEGVVLEYDGKLWMLTDRGTSALPTAPVTSGTSP